jgi:hypothetical protein
MNENTPTNTPDNAPEPLDQFEARRRRREERRAGRAPWLGGVILIGLGIIFLLQNFGAPVLNNWWALFILIPAVGAFGNAWRDYQNAGGRLTPSARWSMIVGLILTMVTAVFLFNLDWGLIGPVLIILAGIGLLLNTLLP